MNKRIVLVVVVIVGIIGAALYAARPYLWPAPSIVQQPSAVAAPKPAPSAIETPKAPEPVTPVPAPEPAAAPLPAPAEQPLTAETLKNTSWERDKFRVDLSPDGSAIVGSATAKWTVEGNRVKLYSDSSPEVHYLDINGSKLYWEGQEIGRAK